MQCIKNVSPFRGNLFRCEYVHTTFATLWQVHGVRALLMLEDSVTPNAAILGKVRTALGIFSESMSCHFKRESRLLLDSNVSRLVGTS